MVQRKKNYLTALLFGFFLSGTASANIIEIERVVTNLNKPVAITHAGDGSGRIFIGLQDGLVVIFDGTELLSSPFLDIQSRVSCCGERGLLGIAFHPDYKNNGYFYLNYTDINGNTAIARYSVSDDPDVADLESEDILINIQQPYSNHNGGHLTFGPDGYLYIGTGDGGAGGDPFNNAQDIKSLLGKILRIDVNNGFPYAIPSDNPFRENPDARGEIWAYGLRNPWRFSFDRLTGDLFIADVGQNTLEEVNFQKANSNGGENYGWRLMEGNHCYNPSENCNDGTLTLPVLEYDHSSGCSITGGYRYRGRMIPPLFGIYLYGDYCSGTIWGAKRNKQGTWETKKLLDSDYAISTFGEDEKGEVYFAHYDEDDGSVYRITNVIPKTSGFGNE
ncbi:MAG: PQQ-dependent sugar dehydrogenase [Candidatus Kuenenia sp.]|nr:PQQ-dependent sugar dehydrogenase [Candidatus Kuenenia hertensis]